MHHNLIIAGAAIGLMLVSNTASAQDAPPSGDPMESPSVPGQIQPVDVPPSESVQAPPPSREQMVMQVVESEFGTYDEDQSGELDKNEFTKWVGILRNKSLESQGRPPVPENEMNDWAKNAFAKADADNSEKISKAELQVFLMG